MEKHEELQTEASEVQGTVPEGKIENGEDKVTKNEENKNLESEQTGNQTENKGEEGKEEKKEKTSEVFDSRTEQLFSAGQVLMAIVGSFAHGANDIANAIGPYAVILSIYQTKEIGAGGVIPWWVLVMGGVGIVTGLATWGYKVIKTIGENLTKVTPARGFNIELGSAFVVLTASRIGIPLSTTHCKVFRKIYFDFINFILIPIFLKTKGWSCGGCWISRWRRCRKMEDGFECCRRLACNTSDRCYCVCSCFRFSLVPIRILFVKIIYLINL